MKNHLYLMSPSSWSFVAMVFRLSSRVISMVVSTGALLKEHMSFASSQPTPARIADVMSTNASHSVKRRRCPFFFSFCRSALLRVERCCVRCSASRTLSASQRAV